MIRPRIKSGVAAAQRKSQRTVEVPLRLASWWNACCQALRLRTRAFSRLLVRAALLAWIRPLFTIVSIFGTAAWYAALAASASPFATAFRTLLMAVRMRERRATLCWRCFSAWRARLADCLEFATYKSSVIGLRVRAPGSRAFSAFAGRMSIRAGACRVRVQPGAQPDANPVRLALHCAKYGAA